MPTERGLSVLTRAEGTEAVLAVVVAVASDGSDGSDGDAVEVMFPTVAAAALLPSSALRSNSATRSCEHKGRFASCAASDAPTSPAPTIATSTTGPATLRAAILLLKSRAPWQGPTGVNKLSFGVRASVGSADGFHDTLSIGHSRGQLLRLPRCDDHC